MSQSWHALRRCVGAPRADDRRGVQHCQKKSCLLLARYYTREGKELKHDHENMHAQGHQTKLTAPRRGLAPHGSFDDRVRPSARIHYRATEATHSPSTSGFKLVQGLHADIVQHDRSSSRQKPKLHLFTTLHEERVLISSSRTTAALEPTEELSPNIDD